RLLTGEEMLARPLPSYLLDGLLVEQSLAVLAGDPKSCKTFVALAWSLHIAAGMPWCRRAVQQRPTIYIVGHGVVFIGRRLAGWIGCRQRERLLEDFRVLAEAVNPLHDGAVNAFVDAVDAAGLSRSPVLIVVDTLARSLAGGNENASEDMGAM